MDARALDGDAMIPNLQQRKVLLTTPTWRAESARPHRMSTIFFENAIRYRLPSRQNRRKTHISDNSRSAQRGDVGS